MNYYASVITDPNADDYMKVVMIGRVDVSQNAVITERFDGKTKKWVDDPTIYGRATGLEDGLDFHEISKVLADGFIAGKTISLNTFEGHAGRPGLRGGSVPKGDSGRSTGNAIDQAFKRGGFTVKAIGLPHEPTTGFVVAQHPELGAVIDGAKEMPRAQLKDKIKSYIKINKDTLSQDGMYLGLWFNEGKLYLDVPSVIMDRNEAITAGRDHDQIAIWDIENSAEIPTGGSGEKGIDL